MQTNRSYSYSYQDLNGLRRWDVKEISRTIILILISALVGYMIGLRELNRVVDNKSFGSNSHRSEINDHDTVRLFKNIISVENIQRHLKDLTSIPHLAGTEGDLTSAKYVENEWKRQRLDMVQKTSYDVYLDYPDENKCNSIEILNKDLSVDKLFEIKEKVLDSDGDYSKISKPFLAYSINGSFNFSEVYYVNYCSDSDFKLFTEQTGISLKGKICLCKYGSVFRGNKVSTAEKYGAEAVLLYDDPYRGAPHESNSTDIFPNGELMPEFGTQRGTIYIHEGDPQTPSYPSIESAYRVSDLKLPKIASQVIGYAIAEELFNLIESDATIAPVAWHGQMKVKYSFGGRLIGSKTLVLNVYNQKNISKIYNVAGMIKGELEPDRYIIFGNHRDSWTYGSIDPTFGTAIMLEVSRMLSELRRVYHWVPKRSVLFQSWSGEEYGLIGSTEWVEEFEKKLSANSVIYINLDVSVYGNFSYEATASPLLYDMLYNITKMLDIGDGSKETVFDRWLRNNPDKETGYPYINPHMGSGSDHMAFLQRAGIPCVDQKVGRPKKSVLSQRMGSSYPLYHTSYETFNMAAKFIDPGFSGSKLLATVAAEIARTMADSTLLPFNTDTYARVMQREYSDFKKRYQKDFDAYNVSLSGLECAIQNFTRVSESFMGRVKLVDLNNFNLVRQYNEQFRSLERAFLDYNNLMKRGYMHMIFSPSILDKYDSDIFPTITDVIKGDQFSNANEDIKYELSRIIYALQSACAVLKEPSDFGRYVF